MLQPAHAATLSGAQSGVVAQSADTAGASFEVAQQAPDAQQGDDQDPRKKKHGEQGQEGGQPQQEGQKPAEHQKPAAEQKPAEQQKPAAEPKPVEAVKPQQQEEKPKPAPAAQPEAQPEAPKPHKQQAQQPEAQPAPAAPAQQEAQPEVKKHKQNAEQQPEAAPQTEAPTKKAVQQEQQPAQAQQPKAPAAEPQQPAQAGQDQQPKKHQKQQADQAEPGAQPAEQVKPAQQEAPAKTPAAKAEGTNEPAKQPATQEQQPGATGEAKPPVPKAQAEGQQPEAKPGNKQAQPEAKPGQQPAGEAAAPANGNAKPAQAAEQPAGEAAAPASGNARPAVQGQQPVVPANGTAPQAEGGQQAQEAVPQSAPVSPQELERRKKIAENPAQATGPVILPVQNGAAVLDSDKDAARRGGHGQRGQGQGQPGQAAGAQGQAQGQAPAQQPAPANVRAPTSDADAQRAPNGGQQRPPVQIEAVTSERGQRMNGRPDFARPDGAQVEDRQDNRVILNIDNNVFVRHDDTQRFVRDGERPTYEQLSRDRFRETIDRPDGDRIVTIRNRYGDIIQRSRIDARGREYVLFYSPELEQQPDNDDYFRDPGENLPPMRLRIPLNQYIIDTSSDQDQDYYDFLREPPVEPVERVYSLNEVRYSARIRDKVRRIDLDTITFATASADIPMAQAKTLRGIADAIGQIIKKDPTESFLIEGHTDAVGTDQSNLILSDQRAESVANVLTDVYGIPPENLATQGYGEQYLKVNTSGPEQENRRVTIRRVTALVRPVASRQ
jgi:outer membrane protein OmpA-like peptidoglycan-associated protein